MAQTMPLQDKLKSIWGCYAAFHTLLTVLCLFCQILTITDNICCINILAAIADFNVLTGMFGFRLLILNYT